MKNYILDTNILLQDPDAIMNFHENTVIIPIGVLEELDRFKKENGDLGRNSREVCRKLDELRELGDLSTGVTLNNGYNGLLKIFYTGSIDSFYKESNVDLQVIQTAQTLKKLEVEHPCVIVTRDVNVRIRANALGLLAENYENKMIKEDIDKGYSELICAHDLINELNLGGKIPISNFGDLISKNVSPNFYFILKSDSAMKKQNGEIDNLLAKVSPDGRDIEVLNKLVGGLRLKPKNVEQTFVLDSLLDDRVKLVSIIGSAGSGKTILSCAAGFYLLSKTDRYYKMLVSRPMVPMGNKDTVGFLPGPQPLTAKILTPNGWTTMGELQIGSRIITRDGSSANVIGIFPKGVKQVYKITTTDGSSTECCKDHLWFTKTAEDRKRGYEGSVKTTQEIMDSLQSKMCGKKINSGKPRYGEIRPNHFIPRNETVQFENHEKLLIPSYTLGCILGDGHIGEGISIANTDQELIDRCRLELNEIGCKFSQIKDTISYNISSNFRNNKPEKQVIVTNIIDKTKKVYSGRDEASKDLNISKLLISERCINNSIINEEQYSFGSRERWRNTVKNELYKLGLDNKRAWDKFIPNKYKYSSIEDRLSLIQGLMDTDGTVNKKGFCCYCTTSLTLANDMVEVVRSLGGRAHIKTRNRIGYEGKKSINNRKIISKRIVHEVTISLPQCYNPFYISRKASKVKYSIIHGVGITSIEYIGDKEVQCILIDNPEHLYITDEFIVTHNTLSEKMDPWMRPIYDAFEVLMSNKKEITDGREFVQAQKNISIEVLSYIRGRSINDQFLIVDETQNTTALEIKTIITRAGENTKIVLTGDVDQIDNPYMDKYSNGLSIATKSFIGSSLASHFVLSKGVRSRLSDEASHRL